MVDETSTSQSREEAMIYLQTRGFDMRDDHPESILADRRTAYYDKLVGAISHAYPVTPWEDIRKAASVLDLEIVEGDCLEIRKVQEGGTEILKYDRYDENGRCIQWSNFPGMIVDIDYDTDGYVTRVMQVQGGGFGHEDRVVYEGVGSMKKPIRVTRNVFTGRQSGGDSRPLVDMTYDDAKATALRHLTASPLLLRGETTQTIEIDLKSHKMVG